MNKTKKILPNRETLQHVKIGIRNHNIHHKDMAKEEEGIQLHPMDQIGEVAAVREDPDMEEQTEEQIITKARLEEASELALQEMNN